jgi:DinB family protein
VATDRGFQAKNRETRERLAALVGRLGDAELGRSVGHGWTVATTLVHLAFWDLRAGRLIEQYRREGVRPSATDVDVLNDTLRALAEAMPPRAAARLAVEAAERVDRAIEGLPDGLVDAIAARGGEETFKLGRHNHRAEHLDEIERALR